MTEVLSSASAQLNAAGDAHPALMALKVNEEQAAAGYLAARKAMEVAAARAASMRQLSAEQPTRVDYRDAFYKALDDFNAASARTRLAYYRYHRSQLRYDARWTDTEGRAAGAA